MTEGTPKLSVVVATDRFETIRGLVSFLVDQTVCSEVEVIAVCPSARQLEQPDVMADRLAALRIVAHTLLPLGEARAAGVREARAPVVIVAETHAFPARDWAERLLAAHEAHWVAVMPAVVNANPATAFSWSSFLVDYGRWAFDGPCEIDDPPAYHTSFKRDALLSFGSRLGALLEPGSTLGRELHARGHRSCFEPRARIEHMNVATPRAWIHERFLGGRLLGASRRARWPRSRTTAYLLGSPLVPVIRLWRTRRPMASASRAGLLPRWTHWATVLGCVAWAVGEAAGYAVGACEASAANMLEYELHKARYLGRKSASQIRSG